MKTTIRPTQTFLHGAEKYEVGEEYQVSRSDALYFVNYGWAESDEFTTDGPQSSLRLPLELTVDDAAVSSDSEGL